MVQSAIDCVRRGFQSFISLWPLLLVRLVETIVILVVIGGGFLLSLVPLGFSLAVSDIEMWADDPESVVEWMVSNGGTIFYLFMVVTLLTGVAVLIHSYFEAGVAASYYEHFRSGVSFPAHEAWDRFSLDSFTEAALARGWSVFLVYNIVWGVAGAVLLIPLGLILVVLLVFRDAPAAIAFTCLGLVVVVILAIIVSIVAATWAQVALSITAGERRGAVESTSRAGDLMKDRLGTTILVVIVVYAVVFGFSSVTSTFNLALSALAEVPGAEIIALVFQIGMFVVNTVISTVLGLWTAAVWVAFVISAALPGQPVVPDNGGTIGSGRAVVG